MNTDDKLKIKLLDQPEIELALIAEGLRIFSAPGAAQKIRYTKAQQNFFSAAVTITVNSMACKIVACFDLLEDRIAKLEEQVAAPGGNSGEKS